jgi:hypothetical protein
MSSSREQLMSWAHYQGWACTSMLGTGKTFTAIVISLYKLLYTGIEKDSSDHAPGAPPELEA